MYSVLLTTVVSFVLCLLLTPLVRGLFLKRGIVDRPDGIRKLHARPVPRVGGVPIAIAYLSAYAVLIVSPLRGGGWLEGELPLVRDRSHLPLRCRGGYLQQGDDHRRYPAASPRKRRPHGHDAGRDVLRVCGRIRTFTGENQRLDSAGSGISGVLWCHDGVRLWIGGGRYPTR